MPKIFILNQSGKLKCIYKLILKCTIIMKKLNRLQINSEKVIKIEELLSLRGGYGSYWCQLYKNEEYLADVPWEGETPPIASYECTNWHVDSPFFGPGHWCDCGC
jgi:hypothetical protein